MKNVLTLLFLSVMCCLGAWAQGEQPKNGAVIRLDETSYEFGDIIQGEKVSHIFTFTNSGNQPLILSDIVTTCGCTAPSWSRDPILPGQSGEIQITFNSDNKMGRQNKGITILSNAINSPARVTISCNILPKNNSNSN